MLTDGNLNCGLPWRLNLLSNFLVNSFVYQTNYEAKNIFKVRNFPHICICRFQRILCFFVYFVFSFQDIDVSSSAILNLLFSPFMMNLSKTISCCRVDRIIFEINDSMKMLSCIYEKVNLI